MANEENSSSNKNDIKAKAVDTGKRIDVSGVKLRTSSKARPPYKPYKDVEQKAPDQEQEPAPLAKPRPIHPPMQELEPSQKIPLYVETVEFDDSGDFAAMLRDSEEQSSSLTLKVGDKVSGKVVHIGKENIFVALSPKIEAAIATAELSDDEGQPKVRLGQKISSYVVSTHGGVTLSNDVAQSGLDMAMLEEAAKNSIPVEGKVMAQNKGGFDVQISNKRAFCPIGQIDYKFVEDPSIFVGRTLAFLIQRIEEGGRNIVVSRRSLLERERKTQALETINGLEIDKKYEAVITRIADFGAFADIGGLEGLIPRSEIAHGHIDRVSDLLSSGDRVEVLVLSYDINRDDPQKSRLSFSLKRTQADPYKLHWDQIKTGLSLEGKVVRIESFGAFVELFPGIDGLIHISQLSENRIAHPKEILSVGDPITVSVISVDDEEKRIGLSLREAVRKKTGEPKEHVKVERGQKASGVVSRIERYGVFLELDNGATALLPQSETDLPKYADLNKAFNFGDKLDVVIIDVDAQNRVRVSMLARKQMEERDSYLQFQTQENAKASFGTLSGLFKNKK